ncbi:Four helix bundle sensory module for signal transduction [Catalinimonas alkaloidigena]|uniref:Four helix bundle sensory module for signal transduction n=1 Tax=Catalinimonas alkaloidigena TaxID=1075417 RepID=A0A1G9VTR7_9BACT|nr:MCP four helix bundle domain-containing protein [Catalinimonas alkaloidigena]SDM75570.1 Four helix bundle sensory module for signal transduction [Catalinimonas alkaloidigena]
MSIYNKIKWVAGILLVFVIVLTTNLIDKDNFGRLRHSIVTIYEDRIIANDLIFELAVLIQEKELAVAMSDSVFFSKNNDSVDQKIQSLIERYEQTQITEEEQRFFDDLKTSLRTLKKLETEFVSSKFNDSTELFNTINHIVHTLRDLSKVQLKEGQRQMALSKRTMDTIDLFTRVETIFLVLMAILIQVIVLYKPQRRQ